MKKLMLLIAVAGLAFAGQAAALDWRYNATSADVGKTVYVLLGTPPVTSWADVDAVAAAAIDSAAVKKVVNSYYAKGSKLADAITSDSAKNVYFVVVSADKTTFDVTQTADMSGSVYDPANQGTSPGANTSISSSTTRVASGSSFGDVPEPTSGILMLVGLGALALRRRRA